MNLKPELKPAIAAILLAGFYLPLRGFAGDAAVPPAHADAKTNVSARLPAGQIIAKYVQAIGGRDAILKHSSHHATGTFEMPAQGLKGELEVFAKKPDKMVVQIDVPGYGKISQGYNGRIGWSIDPAIGPQLLKGKQLEQLREEAEFYNVLHEGNGFKTMETAGITDFEGTACYKLKVVRKSGNETTEYYDTKNNLLIGTTSTNETPFGAVAATMVASDYKQFAEILTPTRLTQKIMGMAQVLTVSRLEYDKVADSAFEPPKQITALLDQ